MGGVTQPGGAGTWTFLSAAVNLGSATADATEVIKTGSLQDDNLNGASYALVIAQPAFTWGAGMAAKTNTHGYFYLQFGVAAEFSAMFQKGVAAFYWPDNNAGANYFPVTQAIVPVTFDPATRIYSLDYVISGSFEFVPVLGDIVVDWRIDMIATISNLASP